MNRSTAPKPQSQQPLQFLQTVVGERSEVDDKSESLSQTTGNTDSDKENEAHGKVIAENPVFVLEGQKVLQGKPPKAPGEDGRGSNLRSRPEESFSVSKRDKVVEMAQQRAPGEGGSGANSRSGAGNDDADMWGDFYNEDDFKAAKQNGANPEEYTDDFEHVLGRVVEEEEDEVESGAKEGGEEEGEISSRSQATGEDDHTADNSNERSENKKGKQIRKKKKRLFTRTLQLPASAGTTSGGSNPELARLSDTHHNHLETMSETTSDRGRRRLSRRKQVSRPRCAGPAPEGDILQQKYQELNSLLLKPLVDPMEQRNMTRQQLRRLHGLSVQYNTVAHSLASRPPRAPAASGRGEPVQTGFVEVNEDNAEPAYTTIRTLQVSNRSNRPQTAHPRRRLLRLQNQQRPLSAGNQREITSNSEDEISGRNRRIDALLNGPVRDGERKKRGSGQKGGDHSGNGSLRNTPRSETDEKGGEDSQGEERNRSGSRSPGRGISQTDTHLKNSANPALRLWLLKKNKEYRKQKAEERRVKRAERQQKQEAEREKEELHKKSEKKVKQWMIMKRKEAAQTAKEERKYQKEVEEQMQEKPKFIPVIRPETLEGAKSGAIVVTADTLTPEPPKSKFVYKRPVSGRVRLMKLQQERKDDTKRMEQKKKELEKLSEEEKNKKMRMSYDQWLLKKRQDDYSKRQLAAKQRALAKSDPELERIVPEMARRRINNIQRGKKRIETGDPKLNNTLNNSFGGGDFGTDGAVSEGEATQSSSRLEVSGSHKSLRPRPQSAKPPSRFSPQISKSPRRPNSAHPRVQAVMSKDENSNKKAFKLPFPPEKGVPQHVASKQKKLFSPSVTSSSNTFLNAVLDADSNFEVNQKSAEEEVLEAQAVDAESKEKRLEPQGSDSLEELNVKEEEEKELSNGFDESYEEPGASFFVTDGNLPEGQAGETGEQEEEMEKSKSNDETVPMEVEQNKMENEEKDDGNEDSAVIDDDQGEESADKEIHDGGKEEENEKGDNNQADEQEQNNDSEAEKVDAEVKQDEEAEGLPKEEVPADPVEPAPEQGETSKEEAEQPATSQEEEDLTLDLKADEEEDPQVELAYDPEGEGEEEEQRSISQMSESKHSAKHVSFSEEAVVFEDQLAGVMCDDFDDFDDEAEDERGDYGLESPKGDDYDDEF